MTHRLVFCVAGPAMAETAGRADGRIEQWPLRHLLPWSKMLTIENLWVTVNGLKADPGHCNSNAAYCRLLNAITG
jgi:hypothetical protein